MNSKFKMQCRISGGNLHIYPKGNLDGSSACQLANLISRKYSGKGGVFINTDQIKEIFPFGAAKFKSRISEGKFPRSKLYFKGENGFKIAPDGCKVLIKRKTPVCSCNGNCALCSCSNRNNRDRKSA